MTNPAIINLATAQAEIADKGLWFEELMTHPDLSAAIYQLPAGATDAQEAHTEEEIYVVLTGTASARVGDIEQPISAGDFLYVPAGTDHRFFDITSDLKLLAIFSPAFGTGAST